MNKTIKIRRILRMMQRPSLLMSFDDHEGTTRCVYCNEVFPSYTYIPVLDNIYLCSRCKAKWDRWGMMIFKEMINYE